MDGLGYRHSQLFNLDIHGYQGQGHTKNAHGIDVSFAGCQGNLELAGVKKPIKSILFLRPTAVDVIGNSAIIVV